MENPSSYNLAVPSTHLVYSEILSVTSAMRKNSRWATPAAYYPSSYSSSSSSARASSLASSLGLRAAVSGSTGASGDAPLKGQVRRDVDLMVGFEELKRDVRASNGQSIFFLFK